MAKNVTGMTLSFSSIIKNYSEMQAKLMAKVSSLSRNMSSSANPGTFILLQFQMAQVTQIGESISNLISQVNRLITQAVSAQQQR